MNKNSLIVLIILILLAVPLFVSTSFRAKETGVLQPVITGYGTIGGADAGGELTCAELSNQCATGLLQGREDAIRCADDESGSSYSSYFCCNNALQSGPCQTSPPVTQPGTSGGSGSQSTCSDTSRTPVGKLAGGTGTHQYLCASQQGTNQILRCWDDDDIYNPADQSTYNNPNLGKELHGWTCQRWGWYCGNAPGPINGGYCCNGVSQPGPCQTPINGVCGSSNGQTFTTTPTTNLCSQGTPSSVTAGTNTFTWTCQGSNGGTTASCSATKTSIITGPITVVPISGLCSNSCIGQEDVDILGRYFADASKYRADLDFNSDREIGILDIASISTIFGSCQGDVDYNANLDLSKVLNCIGAEDIAILQERFADASKYLASLDLNSDGEISVLDVAYIAQVSGRCQGDVGYDVNLDLSRRVTQCPVSPQPSPRPQSASRFCIDQKDQRLLSRFFGTSALYRNDLDFNKDGEINILEVAALSVAMGKCEGDEGYNRTFDVSDIIPACSGGCLVGDSCLPVGTRLTLQGLGNVFCDATLQVSPQQGDNLVCQNDYECVGNVCLSGKCTNLSKELAESKGLLNQILSFVRALNPFR